MKQLYSKFTNLSDMLISIKSLFFKIKTYSTRKYVVTTYTLWNRSVGQNIFNKMKRILEDLTEE